MTACRVHLRPRAARYAGLRGIGAIGILLALPACVCLGVSAQSAIPPVSAPQANATARTAPVQATVQSNPVFDVASIHPNHSDHTARTHIYSYANQGHFVAVNATPLQLLQYAYELPDSRILGTSDSSKSSKYDIEAKSDPALATQLASLPYADAKAQLLKMVQALLKERFRVAAHSESRELPVYFLTVAKNGPKLTVGQDAPKRVDSTGRGGSVSITISNSSHAIADLTEMLYRYTGRIVIDKTELSGNYTLALRFAADDSRTAIPGSGDAASLADAGPSVFSALKDQLGLELKSGKGPVEVLVVDHIEAPTEN